MTIHSVLITVGMVVIVALYLMAPSAANLLGIMPKKWQRWMLSEPSNRRTPEPKGVVIKGAQGGFCIVQARHIW
jgi:hypothetical protein